MFSSSECIDNIVGNIQYMVLYKLLLTQKSRNCWAQDATSVLSVDNDMSSVDKHLQDLRAALYDTWVFAPLWEDLEENANISHKTHQNWLFYI